MCKSEATRKVRAEAKVLAASCSRVCSWKRYAMFGASAASEGSLVYTPFATARSHAAFFSAEPRSTAFLRFSNAVFLPFSRCSLSVLSLLSLSVLLPFWRHTHTDDKAPILHTRNFYSRTHSVACARRRETLRCKHRHF